MEQHTQKAWMARLLWIISEYLVFRSLQHGLTQSCWRPEAPPPPEATGATSLSSWPGCSRKPSLVKLWMILDEDWIVHLAGRWPATQSQECSAHIEIRSLGLTWVFFFLQGGDGNDMKWKLDSTWSAKEKYSRLSLFRSFPLPPAVRLSFSSSQWLGCPPGSRSAGWPGFGKGSPGEIFTKLESLDSKSSLVVAKPQSCQPEKD